MDESVNVLGGKLEPCSMDPVTGYFRNGCCDTSAQDFGSHTICVEMTQEFLDYSKHIGNDLSTPHPEWGFPGLNPGDRWCVCAARWLECYKGGAPSGIYLRATHKKATEIVPLEVLERFAVDGDDD